MRRSTHLALLNVATAAGTLVALWVCWSPWASMLVLATNLVSVLLDQGAKSLQAGGE